MSLYNVCWGQMPETLMHMTPYYPPAITQSLTHAKDVQAAKDLWEFLFRPTFPEPHTCLVFSKYLFNNWIYDLIKSSEQSRRDRYYCPHFCCCSVAKSRPTLVTPCQIFLSYTVSWSLLRLMSIESMMPYNHLFLSCPLLLPSIFPRIRVFSNESALLNKYWSFSFSISPSKEYSGLIAFQFSSAQFSRTVVSSSLWPHESQHARPPCPSPSPGVCSNPRPLSRWCHPAISSSVSPSPPAPNPSQHQSLFQWVNSSHEVAKVLEFQLQRQSF